MIVRQEQLSDVLTKLHPILLLGVDTETTGLEETDRPFALILSDETDTYYFDERIIPGFWSEMWQIFGERARMLVFQNAKFDMRMITNMGITIRCQVYDDNVLARLLRNDHMVYSLDAQAARILKTKKDDRVKAYIKEHNLYETRKDFFGVEYKVPRYDWVPVEVMAEYAQTDARLTYDLFKYYLPKLDQRSHIVLDNEKDLTPVCFQMERTGLMLNRQYTLQALYHEQEMLAGFKETYEHLTGSPFVNSAKSVQKHIDYILPTTEEGNPSLTDDVIEEIITLGSEQAAKVAETVRHIRTYDKRINTYYKSYLNLADKEGIIHPMMWQAGTRTGRFSYSDPNLQNIPKEEDSPAPFVVRGCFQPRPGHVYVSFDYSQMEYRMMAAYANETEIIRAVMGGADFHQATADLFGVTRKAAKTLNFAILYGAGDVKLAGMLGMTPEEAKRMKYKYFMALPKVESLVDSIIRTGKSRGYVTNWFGRNLYANKEFCYALPNHLIQGGGADVVKVAMVRIAQQFPELKMVLQVHDQLIFEVTPEQYWMLPKIKEIMETVFPPMNGMSLTVDVEWSATSLADRDMTKGFPDATAA